MTKAKGLYYLKLELDVFDNLKIKALLKNHGLAGFGFFIHIATKLYRAQDCKLEHSDFIFDALAEDAFDTTEKVKQFIDDCIGKFRLFKKDGDYFYCPHVNEAVEEFEKAKVQYSASGRMGAEARWGKSEPEKGPEPESKPKKINPFPDLPDIKMTSNEYRKLVDKFGEQGTRNRCEDLSNYMKKIGKPDKYKDHYATVLSWERLDEKKEQIGANRQKPRALPKRYTRPEDL